MENMCPSQYMLLILNINIHRWIYFNETYYVPTTLLVVFPSMLFELNIFASPKSEIF